MAKTRAMKEIEEREGRPITDILNDLYGKYGKQVEVAAELGIDQSTLSIWLIRLGLEEKTVLVERRLA